MAQAERDNNRVPTLVGVSSADGVTPIAIAVNPVTNEVLALSTTETVVPTVGSAPLPRDDNNVPVDAGVSSSDGTTILPLHVVSGRLLVKTS